MSLVVDVAAARTASLRNLPASVLGHYLSTANFPIPRNVLFTPSYFFTSWPYPTEIIGASRLIS